MRETLKPGETITERFVVSEANTVPRLAVQSAEIPQMPAVLATAYMIAMMEATATKLIARHTDPGEGSLGVHVNVAHLAATLPGQTVTVSAEVTAVEGRKISFKVMAHDGLDKIGEGSHQRVVVPWERFKAGIAAKAGKIGGLVENG